MTDSPTSNTAPANLEELARIHDLAFEMLTILDGVASYEYAMDHVFSQHMRARIRRVLKEAHGND